MSLSENIPNKQFVSKSELAREYNVSLKTMNKYLHILKSYLDMDNKRLFAPFEVKIIRDYLDKGELP